MFGQVINRVGKIAQFGHQWGLGFWEADRTSSLNFSGSNLPTPPPPPSPRASMANFKLTLANSASVRTLFAHKANEGPVVGIPGCTVVAVIFSYKTSEGVCILAKSCDK